MLYITTRCYCGNKIVGKQDKKFGTKFNTFTSIGSRDSSVGIATRYGLDGPGIESWWGRDFPPPSRPALGPTQPPVQWVPGLSWGVKRPGRGADHPPAI